MGGLREEVGRGTEAALTALVSSSGLPALLFASLGGALVLVQLHCTREWSGRCVCSPFYNRCLLSFYFCLRSAFNTCHSRQHGI